MPRMAKEINRNLKKEEGRPKDHKIGIRISSPPILNIIVMKKILNIFELT